MASLVQAEIRMPSSHESAPVSTVGWAKIGDCGIKAGISPAKFAGKAGLKAGQMTL
jgi:hypothetical protein